MGEVRWQEHAGAVLDRVADFQVIDCARCEFRHVVPLPPADELRDAYRSEYYEREKPAYLEHAAEDRRWWELVYGGRFELFEESLPPSRRRLLDVGSGPGLLLAFGNGRGWETVGLEPSARAAEHARSLGAEVVEDFLTPASAGSLGTFDVVHMSEVLEHVRDPRATVALCRDLLSFGGLLSVAVPNDYNPLQKALREEGADPWWVAPPHHLNYFDFASLARLLEREGFEVLHSETSFPMELFLLMGEDYVGDEERGRACHRKRVELEERLHRAGGAGLLRSLYRTLAELGIGRHVITTARRR